jgi:4'-phosphopantetheinyl transferase
MKIYVSGIQPFMGLDGIDLVTPSRVKRIHAFIQTEDKARCLVAGLLLRRFCGVIDDNQLVFGENGKPYLTDKSLYFNISHSGDYVVLAISDCEIGVDIEKVTLYDDAVTARCFTQAEQEWIKKQGNNEAFFTLWTAKESLMKGFGLGLSLPPESFCVLPKEESPYLINGREWFLDWLMYKGYMICYATGNKSEKIEVYECERFIR